MTTGTIKFYNPTKWFGFIIPSDPSDGGENVFVHVTGIIREDADEEVILQEGDRVEYEVTEGPKGLNAINVRRLPALAEGAKEVSIAPEDMDMAA